MKISVIIPALNETDAIAACIGSCRDDHIDEVIVVDGGSRDDTVEQARRAGAMVVTSPPGRALQMNTGARVATGNVLLFLHADTRLPANPGLQIAAALKDERTVAGSFRLRFDSPSLILKVYSFASRLNFRFSTFGDQGIFVRRRLFESIGGYPVQPLMEDLEVQRILRRCGRFIKLSSSVMTSARRFGEVGPVRQQLINAMLVLGYECGVSATTLKRYYPNAT